MYDPLVGANLLQRNKLPSLGQRYARLTDRSYRLGKPASDHSWPTPCSRFHPKSIACILHVPPYLHPRLCDTERLLPPRARVSCSGLPFHSPTLACQPTAVLGCTSLRSHVGWMPPSVLATLSREPKRRTRDTRSNSPPTWSKAGAMDAHPPRPLRRTYACEGDKISLSEFRDALMRRKLAEMERKAEKESPRNEPSPKKEKKDELSALEHEREKLVARKREVKTSIRVAKKRLSDLESKRHDLVKELKKVLSEEERAKKRALESEDGELPQAFFSDPHASNRLPPSYSAPPSMHSSGIATPDQRSNRDNPTLSSRRGTRVPHEGPYYT